MSNGKAHMVATLMLSIPTTVIVTMMTENPYMGLSALIGTLMGIPINPDLDMQTVTTSKQLVVKYTFGIGYLWLMMWYPYALVIPHRSWASHTPIIGTVLRIVYLYLWLVVATVSADAMGYPQWVQIIGRWMAWVAISDMGRCAIIALMAADALHWLMDQQKHG